MKRPLRILMADLAYTHRSEYVHPVPLNIGYVAAYVIQQIPDVHVDLFKTPEDLCAAVDRNADYDVAGLSNYDWNVNLNRQFLKWMKRRCSGLVTVMGGPNVNEGSGKWMRTFFRSMPDLDVYITNEGEYRFERLIRALIEREMRLEETWESLPNSIFGFDRKCDTVIRGSAADVESCDCSNLPSPYLTGLLDSFLDDPHLVPIIETNRGCPYSCAFCCWGKATKSKILQFSVETVVREIRYIAGRTKNPIRSLYIADANFGILKRDVEIAQVLKDSSVEQGFPKHIYVYFAKNTDEKVLKVAEMLRGMTEISMSKQSLNKDVLKIIGRANISDDKYDVAYARLQELGASSFCELIYALPGETLESFLDGFEAVAQRGLRPVLYPLLLFRGSEMDSEFFREKYQIETAFRIIPRYTGSYHEIHSVEYEEVVVSHALFSRDDFFRIRLIQFLYWIFSEIIFSEFVRFVNENGLNIVSFIRFVLADRDHWPDALEKLVRGFEADARAEMIEKNDLKLEFTGEEIERIRARGLALNIWHFCKLVLSAEALADFRQYLTDGSGRYFASKSVEVEPDSLACVVNAAFDKIPSFPDIAAGRVKAYPFDIERWLASPSRGHRLSQFRTGEPVRYRFEFDPSLIDLFNAKYEVFRNVELALYYFRMDFIPVPYRAYTYIRTRMDSSPSISPPEERLVRDLPQSVRGF